MDALLLFENKQYRTFFDVVWNKIYRKSLFQDTRFPEGISLGEDISILPDLYYKAKRVSVISEKLYNYVYREGSLSNGTYNKEEDYRLRRPVLEQRLEKYIVWDIKELILLRIVRHVFFKGNYKTVVSAKQKVKFLFAAISLKVYNCLVNIMMECSD